LTLGGFDANRFISHNVNFELNDAQQPVLALNEISVTAHPLPDSKVSPEWASNSMTLLGPAEADLFTIDSTTPYLWLPESVCSQFEKVFGLVYDASVELYTFGTNSSQHEALLDWNMTFQFTVADLPGSTKTVSLSLPYAAFDLQLSYPYPGLNATDASPAVNYFPLRKAANSTQYTIGRSFLQETYLTVDYERNNFSIYQATFSQAALVDMNLVDITRPKNSTYAGPQVSKSSSLGKAEIAGVAVGAALAVILLVVIGVLLFRLRRDQKNKRYIRDRSDDRSRKTRSSNSRFVRWLFRLPSPDAPTEIGGAAVWAFEAPDDKGVTELPEKCSHSELEGSTTDVPAYQEADRKNHGENMTRRSQWNFHTDLVPEDFSSLRPCPKSNLHLQLSFLPDKANTIDYLAMIHRPLLGLVARVILPVRDQVKHRHQRILSAPSLRGTSVPNIHL